VLKTKNTGGGYSFFGRGKKHTHTYTGVVRKYIYYNIEQIK
jgi:hypothetical protein